MFEDEIAAIRHFENPCSTDAETAGEPSPLEEEVIGLFDQTQDRLLRYLVRLGLSAPDGEEIIQEVFLALFLHMRQGKPRHNLRGWIFQVAHNLGLKQRNLLQRNRQSLLEYGGTTPDNFFVDAALNPEINWRACSDECDYSVSGKRFPSRTGSAFPFGPKASPIVRSVRFWTCRWALYLFL